MRLLQLLKSFVLLQTVLLICVVPLAKAVCRDALGTIVNEIPDQNLNDVAVADIQNGAPVIKYNNSVLSWFAPQTRQFWYFHECGHHALGHVINRAYPVVAERQADCFAVVELVRNGSFSENDMATVLNDINRISSGDWSHLPGPQRSINLWQCLTNEGLASLKPCNHLAHPAGDCVPCTHPIHQMGDVMPCTHQCFSPAGWPIPCHPMGDIYPCTHPMHPADCGPCAHPLHQNGDIHFN